MFHRLDILTIVFTQVRPVLLWRRIAQLAVAIQIAKSRVEATSILLITGIPRALKASEDFKVLQSAAADLRVDLTRPPASNTLGVYVASTDIDPTPTHTLFFLKSVE